jgi:hypothetical protein
MTDVADVADVAFNEGFISIASVKMEMKLNGCL